MARLSNAQIYAIRWLASQDTPLDKIVEELDLTEKQIKATLEKFAESKTAETKQELKNASEPVGKQNLMITETSGKKNSGVAIMTQAASERADEAREGMVPVSIPDAQKGIFRPKSR